MATAPRELDRPAFYALSSGGWRDLVTILHPPYTLWHLSYVALGAAAATTIHADRLAAALVAFFLAVGISAHALDELRGRPLNTKLSRTALVVLAAAGLVGAVAIGVVGDLRRLAAADPAGADRSVHRPRLQPRAVRAGGFTTTRGSRSRWGGFPAFTGYFVNALAIRPAGILVAAACCMLSAAQRRLSTPARELRRRTVSVEGQQRLDDGTVIELSKQRLADPLEGALSALWLALVLMAIGLVAVRV